MSDIPTLQDLVFEVADIQFVDNSEREAARARDEARELVKRAHAAGVAAERARWVAAIEAEQRRRLTTTAEDMSYPMAVCGALAILKSQVVSQ